VIRRLLTVAPAALLLAACGAPALPASYAAGPVASVESVTTTPAATPDPTTDPTTAAAASPTSVADVVPAEAVAEPLVVRAAAPVIVAGRPVVHAPVTPRAAAPKPAAAKPAAPKPAAPKPAAPKPAAPKPAAPKPAPVQTASGCNANYTPCVPNDPKDVDCQGGSGNGPSYVKGPVTVTGTDVYGLDADHDGIGCE
jgi:hypothetical protein